MDINIQDIKIQNDLNINNQSVIIKPTELDLKNKSNIIKKPILINKKKPNKLTNKQKR